LGLGSMTLGVPQFSIFFFADSCLFPTCHSSDCNRGVAHFVCPGITVLDHWVLMCGRLCGTWAHHDRPSAEFFFCTSLFACACFQLLTRTHVLVFVSMCGIVGYGGFVLHGSVRYFCVVWFG
jgi:hypothetical protein